MQPFEKRHERLQRVARQHPDDDGNQERRSDLRRRDDGKQRQRDQRGCDRALASRRRCFGFGFGFSHKQTAPGADLPTPGAVRNGTRRQYFLFSRASSLIFEPPAGCPCRPFNGVAAGQQCKRRKRESRGERECEPSVS